MPLSRGLAEKRSHVDSVLLSPGDAFDKSLEFRRRKTKS